MLFPNISTKFIFKVFLLPQRHNVGIASLSHQKILIVWPKNRNLHPKLHPVFVAYPHFDFAHILTQCVLILSKCPKYIVSQLSCFIMGYRLKYSWISAHSQTLDLVHPWIYFFYFLFICRMLCYSPMNPTVFFLWYFCWYILLWVLLSCPLIILHIDEYCESSQKPRLKKEGSCQWLSLLNIPWYW